MTTLHSIFTPSARSESTSDLTIDLGRRNSGMSVDENAAGFVQGFKERDLVAASGELARRGQAGGTAADDGRP
jgi:hypothetical protein